MTGQLARDALASVVHVIEDDPSSRKATERVLRVAGLAVREYASPAEFLAAMPSGPGCIVLDLQLPGASGLDLQEQLAAAGDSLPIVFLSGHGDVPRSVRALKAGAVDFLTKPVDPSVLLEAVSQALARDAESRIVRARQREARTRYQRLTPRERQVLGHLISGQLNKQVAFDLGTTEHTIKVHRRRVLEKLEVDSLADLVRLAGELGIAPVGRVR
jgi:FixJ family two-component response regulator